MRVIRPETIADREAVYEVNLQAFGGREAEPGLVEAIRASESFIPELSLVAMEDEQVVGHILFSRIHIETDRGPISALALAPMAVLPGRQNQGIGSELVRHGLEECKRIGFEIGIVLGHPNFYPRFGFSAELAKDLECPFGDAGRAWMALEMIPGALRGLRGRVVYPPPFESV
jgi:putative acetyltransferase